MKLDLETLVVDWDEFKDLQKSFLLASVSDAEIPTDVGIFGTLHLVAAREKIKYILNGHSFRTEGIMPIGWTYMDGKYIANVQKKFGHSRLKTFPNFGLVNFFHYTFIKKIKTVPLLNFVEYRHQEAEKILAKELNWTYYGGHHYESYYTHFFQSYLLPKKFKIDKRKVEYSALVRSGQMTRRAAIEEIKNKPYEYDQELVNYTVAKLGFTQKEFKKIMELPIKSFRDYPTYYPYVRLFKWPLMLAVRLKLIPDLLYQKFFT